jgi:UDPglucose--hexose-1-phosphate uridylyltransferase
MVVYTQEPSGGIGDLDQDDVELLIEVWAHRTLELGAIDGIRYVMPFENRGPEVGATLQHPHGQIFAYPFVPPIPARELEEQRRYLDAHGRGMLEDHLAAEIRDRERIVWANRSAVAFVPAFGRYPYEVWVAPIDPVPSLMELTAEQRTDVAQALQQTVQRYDALRGTPFPYVMVIHQAPTDGLQHPEAHLHFEFYPPYRSLDRLKYPAGTELGAGMFINDASPEAKAAELRGTVVKEPETP